MSGQSNGQAVTGGQWPGQSSVVRRRGVVVANNTLSVGHSTATARSHGWVKKPRIGISSPTDRPVTLPVTPPWPHLLTGSRCPR